MKHKKYRFEKCAVRYTYDISILKSIDLAIRKSVENKNIAFVVMFNYKFSATAFFIIASVDILAIVIAI